MAWFGKRKRERELTTRREHAEALQLVVHALGDEGARAAAEQALAAAREAERRGADEAPRLYADAARAAVRATEGVLERDPTRVAAALLERAERMLASMENDEERCEAALAVLGARVTVGDAAGAERLFALVRGLVRDPARHLRLLTLSYAARGAIPDAGWLPAMRATLAEDLLVRARGEEAALALLDLAVLQAHNGDAEGARATSERLQGDARDQALLVLAETRAQAGDVAQTLATAEEIDGRLARLQAEVHCVHALARAGRIEEARERAQALEGVEHGNAVVQIVGALANAGKRAEAAALLEELPSEEREEARLVLFEEALEREEFELAREISETLEGPAARTVGWSRLSEVLLRRGDHEGARSAAERIEDPVQRAQAVHAVGWALLKAGGGDAARECYGLALELASDALREEAAVGRPGGPGPFWLSLASQAQCALGDWESALANAQRASVNPEYRRHAMSALTGAVGLVGDLEVLEEMLSRVPTALDGVYLLYGAALGVHGRVEPPAGGQP